MICGVSFIIHAICVLYVCSVLSSSKIISLENVSYVVVFNHVYETNHLDIVSYPLVSFCGMVLDSSVSFFFAVDGIPMFVFATLIK